MKFYHGRDTAEQWIKERNNAVKWTNLSCRMFNDNLTRLKRFVLPYNLGNFLRRLALPRDFEHWSLTTLREKLVKIGVKVTRNAKYVTFQLAEVAVTWDLFVTILDRIARLAIPPPLAAGYGARNYRVTTNGGHGENLRRASVERWKTPRMAPLPGSQR